MRKKVLIIIIAILIIIMSIGFIFNRIRLKGEKQNKISNQENNIDIEVAENKDIQNISEKRNSYSEGNSKNTITSSSNLQNITTDNIVTKNVEATTNKNSLPDDTGLTVGGVKKTYNQDIMAQGNIAYLLGCSDFSNINNLDKYIEEHKPKNGIFISKVTGYDKTENPYDFVMDRSELMKKMLSGINMTYHVDKNNYLIDNKNETSELDKKINKIIASDKKIIIGFVPAYYMYINDTEMGLTLTEMQKPYISLKPYNNIYTYICDPDDASNEDFLGMIEEISQISD